MAEPVVVQELTRRFGDFTAVDRVSFTVAKGEIFGFLGPNGAGKTTTIKMLTGLLRPTSGDGRVAGLDIRSAGRDIARSIGYMSQLFSLYGDLTVAENIELFAGLYGVEGERYRARRAWVLDMAGLEEREDLLTADLPLGWKQRLALGCAVIHEPPILFLDEPTSGVDPVARRAFWDLINELAEAGTTVLVTTHYMEEAEHCRRLALMNRGRLVALDSPSALRASMSEPLYQVQTPEAPRAVEALAQSPGVLEASLFGRAVHVVMKDAADAESSIRGTLAGVNVPVQAVDRIAPALEDVFVALIRREGGAVEG
ncbi:MAG TPA: ABC transporter ATP-binding protein [Longimicrobiales bacterium]|nr:ABC transporter ATP-binding protein [Longimicrobiales bacterium]